MKEKKFSQLLFLNGQPYILWAYKLLTLAEVILYFSYMPHLIVVECNGKIASNAVDRSKRLNSKDRIETITIVGGG